LAQTTVLATAAAAAVLVAAQLFLPGLGPDAFAQTASAPQGASKQSPASPASPRDPAAFLGRSVTELRVQGNRGIEKDAILGRVQTRVGKSLQAETVRSDIQALFSMGYFNDIDVQAESASEGSGVIVTYVVRERPVIAAIEFDGNERLSSTDLAEVVKVKQWSILDFNKVQEDVALIQKHYEDKGFYLAKVSFAIRPLSTESLSPLPPLSAEAPEPGTSSEAGQAPKAPAGPAEQVALIYKIQDYDKVQIKKITFLNNTRFSDEKLKSILAETREGGLFSFMSGSGSFKESAFKTDLQRLTYWYLENGYVKFRYDNPIVTVSDDKRWLFITIRVDEGEAYRIGSYGFGGDLLFPTNELRKELTLTEGELFGISRRNADIQSLTEKYQDLGYAFTNVIPKMAFNDDARTVDIEYVFEKGNLVHFGEINVIGNTKTHDKVIRRELKIREGELYSGSLLRISRENVERLGYFQPGEVIFNTVSPKGKPDVLDVDISIKERSTGTITLGAGYGSVQGFFLTTQISEINTFGRGQTLTLAGQYARDNRAKSLNLGFTEPFAFDTKWVLGGDLFYVFFPIPNKYDTRKWGANLRLGYLVADFTNLFFTYKNERITVLSPDASNDPAEVAADNGLLSSVVGSMVYDRRNNRFETTAGDFRSVSLEFAGLGGEKRFIKAVGNNRFYRRVVGDLVFRNSIEVGHIFNLANELVPPSERFFLGGPNNMRGYNLFSVGPTRAVTRTGTGGASVTVQEPLGGTSQFFALSELEYPLIREAGVKLVTFFDAGNAFTSLSRLALRTNYGVGFRWFSPIGPLRFEWGFPLNRRANESESVFQFFIGPPF
jgi:outer membrane protein insertion porin family